MKIKMFTQENCAPCRKLKPRLEEINVEKEYVDVEENLEAARKHKVTSTPTTLIIEDGEVQEKIIGDKEDKIRKALK